MDDGPADFRADLSNCDREPIHLLGAIQPFGWLLAFSSDWSVVHASANVGSYTGIAAADLLGETATRLLDGDALHAIRSRLQLMQATEATERLFAIDVFGDGCRFDIAVHMSGGLIVLEGEPCTREDRVEAVSLVRTMMQRLRQSSGLPAFLEHAARQLRAVTGFDRVMVYRFLDDGSGEVVAEARSRRAPSYLGLRYPASDIPVQARALYLRNTFRIIADVDAEPVPVIPPLSPEGRPLDLSLSVLRSVSPIHIEYLRNMGVGASMSVSIVVDGRLWGLFACHHLTPRQVSFDRRTAAELFGDLFSLELATRERQLLIEANAAARSLHDRVMATMSIEGSAFDNLAGNLGAFRELMRADGAGVWIDGQWAAVGRGLNGDEARRLVRFLNRAGATDVFATAELPSVFPDAEAFADRAAGLVAIPVSRAPRDYLLFTRGEVARTVTWAGSPEKPVEVGPNGIRLTPRKSFEAWRELVRGTSEPWTSHELAVAGSLRATLLEVILRSIDQSRAIRRKAQETQDLLIGELNHRVRNILTLIRGIVRQTADRANSVAEFGDVLGGRIESLARAHDQLTSDQWSPAPLRPLLENEVEAYLGEKLGRIRLNGPDVALAPSAYTTLALVIHEMVTNSAKYGSLSDSRGRLDVTWEVADSGALVLEWAETSGPPVQAPTRRGFGSALIERAIPFDLGGEATVEFAVTGVRARFEIPARFVSEAGAPEVRREAQAAPERAVARDGVLLVEDNIIIAMDAEAMLVEAGFSDVYVANSTGAALQRIEAGGVSCAILDINLGSETSIIVAERLGELGIPFIFASGYGEGQPLPRHLERVPVITKPYAEAKVLDALERATAAA
jgi:light-regulated signal transduction histidine kinase (bacteriophytochrome)/CheY-like chemotaxis protein